MGAVIFTQEYIDVLIEMNALYGEAVRSTEGVDEEAIEEMRR